VLELSRRAAKSNLARLGSDVRFFTSVGTPTIPLGEMTVAGV
jgi:hypothetical protein